ncbi:MAG: SCO family protein [Fimbriiglobus sp.]
MSTPVTNETPPRIFRLRKALAPVLLLLAIVGLISAIFLPVPPIFRKTPKPQEALSKPLPEFRLTERSGKTVTKEDLKGKVWVAAFVFTRCNGPCPSVSATMARLQKELNLAGDDRLRLVTFTVDPNRDGLADLKKYADNFAAHPDRWLFLTSEEAEIHRLMKTGFMMAVERSPNPMPIEGQEFDHSTFLVVVDAEGNIRGHFDGYQGPNDENGERFQERFAALKASVAGLLGK